MFELAGTELFLDDAALTLALKELSTLVLSSGRGLRPGGDNGPRVEDRLGGDIGPRFEDRVSIGGDFRLDKLVDFDVRRDGGPARDLAVEMLELLD